MSERIMMQLGTRRRPLTLDGASPPLLCSGGTVWGGLPFEVHRLGPVTPNVESGPLDGDHGVLVVLAGRAEMVVNASGREWTHVASPGCVALMSGDDRPTLVRVTGTAVTAAVPLGTRWLDRMDAAPPAMGRTLMAPPDETIRALVQSMCEEVKLGAGTGRLYAESLSLAFLHYVGARFRAKEQPREGRLSDSQCRRVRRHVRERLQDDLSLAELAALVRLGPRHFSTLFRRSFGTSPYRYVLNQRLAEGARLLASGRHEIAEVALRVGFSHQSHFTAAFRRRFGVTPRAYARHGPSGATMR